MLACRHSCAPRAVLCTAQHIAATHLPLLQLLVQLLLQGYDVQARRRRAGHILHPQLALLRPLPGAQRRWWWHGRVRHALLTAAACASRVGHQHGAHISTHLGGRMELRMSSVCVTLLRGSTGGRGPCVVCRQWHSRPACQLCGVQQHAASAATTVMTFLPAAAALPPCLVAFELATSVGVSYSTRDLRTGGMLGEKMETPSGSGFGGRRAARSLRCGCCFLSLCVQSSCWGHL